MRSCSIQITRIPSSVRCFVRSNFSERLSIQTTSGREESCRLQIAERIFFPMESFLHKKVNAATLLTGGMPISNSKICNLQPATFFKSVEQLPMNATSCPRSFNPFMSANVCTSAPPKRLSKGKRVKRIFMEVLCIKYWVLRITSLYIIRNT